MDGYKTWADLKAAEQEYEHALDAIVERVAAELGMALAEALNERTESPLG